MIAMTQTIVIKFGGNAMVNDDLIEAFAADMVALKNQGMNPVVVHGGGPQISAEFKARGITSEFKGGFRVTTPESIGVVRDVLVGQVQQQLVDLINSHGDFAHGIAGDEHDLLTCQRQGVVIDGVMTDIGLVGEVTQVNPTALQDIIGSGKIPVVSTVARDEKGQLYNVNADSAAGAVAVALHADTFIVLTDVPGLYRNWPDTSDMITSITCKELESMLPSLESGMIPKMHACIEAVRGGLPEARIVDGRVPHCIEQALTENIGTTVIP